MSSEFSIGAMNQLADALERAGFNSGDLTKLRQSDLKEIKNILNKSAKVRSSQVYSVMTNYDVELSVLLKKYCYFDSNIKTENFPAPKNGREEVVMDFLSFNYGANVASELRRIGLRPANLYELLAFAGLYPDFKVDPEAPIIALGSIFKDCRKNKYACRLDHFPRGGRALDLRRTDCFVISEKPLYAAVYKLAL